MTSKYCEETTKKRYLRMASLAAASAACALTLVQPASADTCDSPVKYADDAKAAKFIHSNACATAGQVLSSVGKAAVGAVLSAYGIPGFTQGDPFAAHAAAIISEIKKARISVINEVDALWLSVINDQKLIQTSSYSALLTLFGETWSKKSLTAKIADLAELDVVINDLQALHDRLRVMVLSPDGQSPENPTKLTRFKYHDLLHVYLSTVDLLAAARAENVYIDELAGRIQTCASDPNMNSANAQQQVDYCLSRLSPSARQELDDVIATQSALQMGDALHGGIAFATDYSNTQRVFQTVFHERFGTVAGGAGGEAARSGLVKLVPSSTLEKTWEYLYNGKKFYVKVGTVVTSSDGTALGYTGSFDGYSRDYGSAEEVVESHRRRVYFEMLMSQYVPMRRLLDHWWESLRAISGVTGDRPYLALDADVDALALGKDAPGYKAAFTNAYTTRRTAGTWKPTWEQELAGTAVQALVSVADSPVSQAQRAALIGGALGYGPWYLTALYYGAGVDPLTPRPKQSWQSHLSLIRRHNLAGRTLTNPEDVPSIVDAYRGQFAAKFAAIIM